MRLKRLAVLSLGSAVAVHDVVQLAEGKVRPHDHRDEIVFIQRGVGNQAVVSTSTNLASSVQLDGRIGRARLL